MNSILSICCCACIAAFLTAFTTESRAAVVAVDLVPNVGVPDGSTIPLDLNSDGVNDITFVRDDGATGFAVFPALHSRIQAAPSAEPGEVWAYAYLAGQEISAVVPPEFSWRYDPGTGNLLASCVALGTGEISCLGFFWDYINTFATKFVGIEFNLADGVHYGYVEVRGTYGAGRLESFGWETTPGTPIIAGSVPEPGRSLLLIGALAVILRRRRRAFGAG